MSQHMESKACVILVPCLSNHINSSRYDRAVTSPHPLKFGLRPAPVALNVFCVNPSDWIFKMEWMVYSVVTRYSWKCGYVIVCPPLITPYFSARFGVLLDDGQQSGSIPLCHNTHHSKCRFVGGVYHAKYPHWGCWCMTTMVLTTWSNCLWQCVYKHAFIQIPLAYGWSRIHQSQQLLADKQDPSHPILSHHGSVTSTHISPAAIDRHQWQHSWRSHTLLQHPSQGTGVTTNKSAVNISLVRCESSQRKYRHTKRLTFCSFQLGISILYNNINNIWVIYNPFT